MASKSILECERNSFENLKKYQLPNGFKRFGVLITVAGFIALFANKFILDSLVVREISKMGMLIGLLVVSVSKEKIEDELVVKMRMQSYAFAFIAGVMLSLFQPFANYFVDILLNVENPAFKDNGDFQILWILLSVQVFCFELLKRTT